MTDRRGKSDSSTVPSKSPNKAEGPAAEAREGKELAKGNSPERNALRTQGRGARPARSSGYVKQQERIGNSGSLRSCTTSMTLIDCGQRTRRLRRTRLQASMERRGGTMVRTSRPTSRICPIDSGEECTEQDLYAGFTSRRWVNRASFGHSAFLRWKIRLSSGHGRGVECDLRTGLPGIFVWVPAGTQSTSALDALAVGIGTRKVSWVLDADIRRFYDTLDHGWLVKFVEHRVADRRVVRSIQKWLKAGVLEEGKRVQSEIGTVQGGSISPLLSNIYLHYTLDLWVRQWRRKQAHGEVIFVRFADDFVVGFQHRYEAERFLAELRERFAHFGLQLHADKTRIVEFGRFAEQNRRQRGEGKPETFNFLGFTHICGRTRKGHFTVLRQTMRQRQQAKLRALKEELRRRMHTPIGKQGAYLRSVLAGHFRYYGVPMNGPALNSFHEGVGRLWWRILRRRGQKHHLPWRRMRRYIQRWFPAVRICHPYPLQRLGVVTQGGSRMR